MDRKTIHFTLISAGETLEISAYYGEYRNLMDLINDKMYVEDFGECRGIGRCGTCLVSYTSENTLPEMDRNEKTTLEKAGVDGSVWRLSCQVMIDELLDGSVIEVAEERPDVR